MKREDEAGCRWDLGERERDNRKCKDIKTLSREE